MKQVEPIRNWPLTPSKTAVLVVDVQFSEYTDEVLSEAPEMSAAMHDRMLPALTRLVDGARASGCEIIYTVIEALTADGRDRSLDHKLSDILVPRGSPLAKTLPEARQQKDDILIPKTSSGVFNSTNLSYLLRNMGLDRVIVAGLLTDQCVDMAVRDGADLGFYMICAEDACVTKTNVRHDKALAAFGGYCRTETVDEILQQLRAAG
ncbi:MULTISPECIES: cysteine hydrolase family protein [unclassified Sulfitobacter]|uniref:cysteine hydrolase family protein n=1 Tax=unclassified Sulfitobacter TaxID=196795 RepID=UPI0007C306D5|nr:MULTISPECIES: isochorismatase family cysteine hydrolase [unclassified Sulfitobacter]KZX97180.1 isochorismatase [Sulfitobacter sp. HI0027]KZX97805.1 isochorismatase [Sulfitobacter sp. HI0021]